ncbi:MAG: GAF domain-containing protein [Candidatus Brocadiia bacterium]|jgi:PAS domain S-box-containing protein
MGDKPTQNPSSPADATQPQRDPKSVVHLNLIFEVGRASLSKLDMGDLLATAAQAIQRHFGYYDVSIFLLDPDAQECVLVAHAGDYYTEGIKGYRQKLSVGIVGWVASHGQTVLANDVRNDSRHVVAFQGEAALLSELTVPIRLHGKTLGVINVERREVNAFDDSDVMTMETLSDQLAQAIANAQLFEQTSLLLDLNRSVLDAVPSSLCVLDSQMRILFTNPRFCRFFGRTAEEAHGMDIRQLLPPTLFQQGGLESAIHRAAAESEPLLCPDLSVQAPDQPQRYFNVHVAATQVPEGGGVLLLFEDITDRRRSSDELLREKQKLEQVVDLIGAGLALIGRDHRILWANRTISEWFGRGAPVVGRRCHEVYCRRDTKCVSCPSEQCFATAVNGEAEVILTRSDGALREYHHAVTPVLDENAQVDQVLKLTLDVTDETKKLYQLARLRQIGELMQGVLDLDRLLHFVLTCVTAGQALGFNRALLFLVDKDRDVLEGKMGVGPASAEEAGRIWSQITRDAPTLEDLLARYDRAVPQTPSLLDQLARGICVPLSDSSHIAVACAFGRRPIVVSRPLDDRRVSEDFRRLLGSREFVLAPLIAHGEPVGVILADNLFSGQPISEDHVELLSMFANQAAIAIENAGNYRRLQEEKMHLEAAYRDLGEAEDKLVRSERLGAVGRMAAHVAHEIRNPLVTIGGFANTLLEHPDSPREDLLRYLKIIVSEVRRLEEILARVMDFTRPPKALLREGAIEPVIRETIEPLRQRAQDQRVEIRLDLPPDEARLQIDADQMKQVFINLFRNALDAMRDGGRLTVQVAHEPGAVKITIANNGDPIRPEDLPKLFEPFFTTKPGGTGLGLSVSQRIVQDHGGSIRVVSSLERGTEFVIALPRKDRP